MSRLYDALKEASGFRQGADGNAGDGVWEALGIDGIEIPPCADTLPVANDPEASEASGADSVLVEKLGLGVPEGELPHSIHIPLESSLGVPAKIVLNERARLIPHAVDPVVVEYYRKLRTKILQQQEEKAFRSLVVTSAAPQEGKTVTVLNLGLSFAMLPSLKVLVVDGDMRQGSLGAWLGVDNQQPGLSNLIDGSARLEEVVLQSDEIPMHCIVRGNSQIPDLHSSQLNSHFQRMTEQFDLVLVDSPPVNLITDVQLLAASCDAVLLVARAFATSRKAFEKAVQDLLPFRVIGTVLNAGSAQGSSGYYPY